MVNLANNLAILANLAVALGTNPVNLCAVVSFETSGTLSRSIKNPRTGATGLIQFMPNTAKELGTTVTKLSKMDFADQATYVYKYLLRRKYKGTYGTKLSDDSNDLKRLYSAVFFGSPDHYIGRENLGDGSHSFAGAIDKMQAHVIKCQQYYNIKRPNH